MHDYRFTSRHLPIKPVGCSDQFITISLVLAKSPTLIVPICVYVPVKYDKFYSIATSSVLQTKRIKRKLSVQPLVSLWFAAFHSCYLLVKSLALFIWALDQSGRRPVRARIVVAVVSHQAVSQLFCQRDRPADEEQQQKTNKACQMVQTVGLANQLRTLFHWQLTNFYLSYGANINASEIALFRVHRHLKASHID